MEIDKLKEFIQRWVKLLGVTGLSQVFVQALGFVSGILIIRLLPVEEYALYTLANTMLGTMTVLSDGGISAGVMSEGGKVYREKKLLGSVLSTGLYLRKKFAIFSLLIAAPILLYLLLDNGASMLTAILIVLSLIPAFFAALSDTLFQIVPKLHQQILPLQRNQIEVSLFRLLLVGGVIFIFPFTYIALLSNGVTRIYGNYKLKKIAKNFVTASPGKDSKIEGSIMKIVKRTMPSAIYYSFSGQITIWIISIFGSTYGIAQLGALARFNLIFMIVASMFKMLFVPRFSRIKDDLNIILNRLLICTLFLLVASSIIVLLINLFNKQLLFIIGSEYSNLNHELFLISISGAISLISISFNSLLSSRGIVVPPLLFISTIIIIQVVIAFIVPLDSVSGVIYYSIYTVSSVLLIRIIYLIYFLKNHEFSN